jgi:cobalt-zinc-cadmium efflux system membrane fusion protein
LCPLAGLFLVAALGCARGAAQELDDLLEVPTSTVRSDDEGAIVLSDEARRFVRVEAIYPAHGVTALRAPARIAFRDGAIAEVGSPVAGWVSALHVRVGDQVDVGDPLLTLRSPDAAATRAQLAAARIALEGALAEARRSAEMLERGVGTERERRAADLRVAELEIELARARTAVSIVGRGRGGDFVIRAPIAGTVLGRRAAIGMAVEPGGEALVEIGDPRGIAAIAEIFDRDAPLVRLGADVEVAIVGFESPLRGRVAHIAPVVTAGLRTVPVRVELDAIPAGLRAGLYGRASISLVDEGLVLPSTAVLVRDGQRTVVYVEEGDGRFVRREVVVGPSIDGRVHVIAGLREGERVVVEGALLIDGAADQLL